MSRASSEAGSLNPVYPVANSTRLLSKNQKLETCSEVPKNGGCDMLRLMRSWICLLVGSLLLTGGSFVQAEEEKTTQDKPATETKADHIQLAILLDTSNSMDGLINQARTQLWKIVNELATAKRNGQVPQMQVALYEYGKSTLSRESGYLRQLVPLTDDLDKISEELFALKTQGGQEYCGQVIAKATTELKWSDSNDDLKLIFIAGNEPFTQGSVDYKKSCADAIAKGIT
ncbi:MAG: VWA domain-containing protein, partial [Planctomycetaceae bacterium]|nr:VWA domain-containing protein [Planctomycetaceae bacterium]